MKNSIAIVIPYYKIDFFEETLKSVASQIDKRFTLYIGNDASPDNPLQLIEKYFPEGNYHYFDYKENLGGKNLAMQWERILENVKEEWFQILGDDDMISENFVEEFYKNIALIDDNIKLIRIKHQQIDDVGNVTKDLSNQINPSDSVIFFQQLYEGKISATLSENIFNIKTFKKYGFRKIPLAWGTDHLAILELADFNKIHFIKEASVFIRITELSISGNTSNLQQKENAKQLFRKIIITDLSKYFEFNFLKQVFNHYLSHSKKYNQPVSSKIISQFISLGRIRTAKKGIDNNLDPYFGKINKKYRLFRKRWYRPNSKIFKNLFLEKTADIDNQTSYTTIPKVIYCFWTGANEMSENRKNAIASIKANCGIDVKLITPENIDEYVIEDFPLHKAFPFLSNVHKSDYLRCYFMHHYGGGYSDIKIQLQDWNNAFKNLEESTAYAIGYQEISKSGTAKLTSFYPLDALERLSKEIDRNYYYLIGNGSYIFKRNTNFTDEWITELHRRLDIKYNDLKKNPGNIMGDNIGYPLEWTSILGQIFHPLCLKYHKKLLYDNSLKPLFINYR